MPINVFPESFYPINQLELNKSIVEWYVQEEQKEEKEQQKHSLKPRSLFAKAVFSICGIKK